MMHVDKPKSVIAASRGWPSLRLGELWEYRELAFFLVWRDIKVRYKQTVLGAAWAVMNPLLTMIVFSVLFGRLGQIPSEGVPYPLFAYAGLLPWQLFAHAVTDSGESLVANRQLITKVYFPRLIIPLAAVLSGLADFCISFLMLVALMFYYGVPPTINVVSIPLFLLLAVGASAAAGLWLSSLNVQYRDIRYTIPLLTQVLLFATPIAYPVSLVPQAWRGLYGLNPMAGVVEGFRWALLGGGEALVAVLPMSVLSVGVLFVGGLYYFRHLEKTFADVV